MSVLKDYYVNNSNKRAARISFIYFALGIFWITFSDEILNQSFSDPVLIMELQSIKGWLFILITTYLFYILMNRELLNLGIVNKKLAESEARWQFALEGAEDGVWDWMVDQDTVYYSKQWKKIIGYEENEIENLYDEWKKRVHPKDIDKCITDIQAHLNGLTPIYTNEHRMIHKNGNYIWILARGKVISKDKSGKPIRMIGTHTDITTRKNVEDKIKRSEQLLTQMGETANIGGWEFDAVSLDGTWTEQVARIHDLDPKDRTNVEIGLSFYKEESRKKIEDAISKAISNGVGYDLELEMISAKGKEKWVRTIGNPISIAGKTVKLQGSFQDITESKLASQALKESEERFSKLFLSSPVGMSLIENETNKFILVNDAIARLTGFSAMELIGKTADELNLVLVDESVLRMREIVKKKGAIGNYEIRFRRKSGEVGTMLQSAETIEIKSKKYIMYSSIDITESKKAAERIRLNEEKLRAFFNSNLFGTINGDVYGKIFAANDEYLRIIGYTRNELEQDRIKWNEITPEEWLKLDKAAIIEAQLAGSCTPYEKQYIRKDGSRIWVMVGFVLFGEKREESIAFILDLTPIKEKERELQESRDLLRRLHKNIQNSGEKERAAIAREIHDEFGQVLTSLKVNLILMTKQVSDGIIDESIELLSEIDGMIKIIDDTVERMRNLVSTLRPDVLDKLGLVSALFWQFDKFKRLFHGNSNFNANVEEIKLASEIEISIFRIFQEALTNITRHSQAQTVIITLSKNKNLLILNIEDDGKGFNPSMNGFIEHFGLVGMQERAKMINADLNISSLPGEGTQIKLTIPIDPL